MCCEHKQARAWSRGAPDFFSLWGVEASHLTCQDLSLCICKVGLLVPALFLREVKRC